MAHNLPELTEGELRRWGSDFVEWSESRFGFYVRRRFDMNKRRWVTQPGPVTWQPFERRALGYVFRIQPDGTLPFKEVYWIDTGQTGKTLKQAAVAQWLCQFHETDAEAQLTANSKDQTGLRVYRALRTSVLLNPWSHQIASVQKGRTLFLKTGNVAMPLPMNAVTQAGGSPVFRGMDEIWGWVGAEAQEMAAEMKESPARNISLLMATSYPGYLDDVGPLNSVLNTMFDDQDAPLPHVRQPLQHLPLYTDGHVAVWWNHDATRYPWVTERFLTERREDPKVTPGQYLRIWEARRSQREDTFMPLDEWLACADRDLYPLDPEDRNVLMVIGVDLGVKADTSACVARGYDLATGRYVLLAHRIWDPKHYPASQRKDIVGLVQQWILDMHRRHRVLGVFYDPSQALHMAALLEQQGVKMFEVGQNKTRETADTDYRQLILSRKIRNYEECEDLTDHIRHAVGTETRSGGIRIEKRKTSQHIDGVIADSQACYGVTQLIEEFQKAARPARAWKDRPRGARWGKIYRLGAR